MRAGPAGKVWSAALVMAALLGLAAPVAARADEWDHRGGERSGRGLHLELGGLYSDAGAGGTLDLGLWFGPFLATGGYRVVDTGVRGRVAWSGGRLHYLLLDADWVAVHAGLGAGALQRQAVGASSTGVALTAGAGVTFGQRDGFNLVGLGVELWAPVSQPWREAAPRPQVPIVMAMLTVNPLYLYALK